MKWINFLFFKTVFLVSALSFSLFDANLRAGDITQVKSAKTATGKRNIPVVLSSDNNYAKYMYIAAYSMLKNASANTYYNIYMQISNDFSKRYKDNILELAKKYPCTISFIEMDKHMPKVLPGYFPPAAYYRLLAPILLPDLDKCIYIDSDVLVLKDLTELYDIDIQDYYLAGVENGRPSYVAHLHWYVNSGVLLMNLKAIREAKLTDRFIEMSEYGVNGKDPYTYPDQDILNIVCDGKVKGIDCKYNFGFGITAFQKELRQAKDKKTCISEALNNAVILHFLDIKPWKEKGVMFADKWWNYAKESPFYEEIMQAFPSKK
jgi:lipopolysaccharide biosynthesis glycosyltransferase